MAKRVKGPHESDPNGFGMLSVEDRAALDKEAQAAVSDELKQKQRDEYYEAKRAEFRRGKVPEDAIVNVTIDVPSYIGFIMLDGTQFFHGYTYPVPLKTCKVLFEQMQRAWHHQDEIDGRGRVNAYRRPQDMRLGPGHAGSATVGQNGSVVLPPDTQI